MQRMGCGMMTSRNVSSWYILATMPFQTSRKARAPRMPYLPAEPMQRNPLQAISFFTHAHPQKTTMTHYSHRTHGSSTPPRPPHPIKHPPLTYFCTSLLLKPRAIHLAHIKLSIKVKLGHKQIFRNAQSAPSIHMSTLQPVLALHR
jgi:hypothetical protein